MEETQAFRHLTRDADTGVGIELGFNKIALGKLFKTPISERWGKQICLNE